MMGKAYMGYSSTSTEIGWKMIHEQLVPGKGLSVSFRIKICRQKPLCALFC